MSFVKYAAEPWDRTLLHIVFVFFEKKIILEIVRYTKPFPLNLRETPFLLFSCDFPTKYKIVPVTVAGIPTTKPKIPKTPFPSSVL